MPLQQYVRQLRPRTESYIDPVDRIQDLLSEEWSKANVAIALKKYPHRREHFLKKYKNEEEFILKTSPDPVKFVYDKGVYDKIE